MVAFLEDMQNRDLSDIKGSSGFPDKELLPYVLSLLNSKGVAQAFIKILNPTMNSPQVEICRTPVIKADVNDITLLSKECIDEAKEIGIHLKPHHGIFRFIL